MEYLPAPYIHIDFYWDGMIEQTAYARVFTLFLNAGYSLRPPVTAMRARAGSLPRFDALHTHGLPPTECKLFSEWQARDVVEATEWLPVSCRLDPPNDQNVSIDLGYSVIACYSFDAGDPHAVEIIVSGGDYDTLLNHRGRIPNEPWVRRARVTAQWYRAKFDELCCTLRPTYASCRWEWPLYPPQDMINSGMMDDWTDLYVDSTVVPQAECLSEFTKWRHWSAVPLADGVFVSNHDRAATEEAREVVRFMRQVFAQRFPR